MTTIMAPFQCDLHPQIQETHRTTHTGTTTRCRTQRRNQNDPSRTRRTHEVPFIAGRSHFSRKNTSFRAPASSPKQSPCNIHAAITMRFAAFPSLPCALLTTSLCHHFPKSPLPFVTTLCHNLLFFCDVLLCDVKSHTALQQCQVSQCDVKSHTVLHQCQVLSVTRKYCFPSSVDDKPCIYTCIS